MEAVAYAPIGQDIEVIDAPVSNATIAELETPRVLFFAMDDITDTEKRELPFKEFGGIHMPHIKGLMDNKGMLYRCQFTRLGKFKMVPDWDMMVGPKGATMERSFVRTVVKNGVAEDKNVDGFLESDAEAFRKDGSFKQRLSKHLVFNKRYPAHDVAKAVKRTAPYGTGGVVEIKALKGASQAEVSEAQMFFFPEWNDIKRGISALPQTSRETQAYIQAQIDTIKSQDWTEEKKQQYYSIGKDMIQSVTEYRRNALDTVRGDEIIVKDAATKGAAGTVKHSEKSEKFLEVNEGRRREDLLVGQGNDVAELAREMREERKANAEMEARRLEIEERKLRIEEAKLGLTSPVVAPPMVAAPTMPTLEDVVEVEPLDMTTIEPVADDAVYAIGSIIDTPQGQAEVIGKPFGRVKVRLTTGEEVMLDKL